MDGRRWPYDPHAPPDDEAGGWMAPDDQPGGRVPRQRNGHTRPGYVQETHQEQWYGNREYGQTYGGRPAPDYPPPNRRYPPPALPPAQAYPPAQHRPGQHRPAQYPPAQYPPAQYPPAQYPPAAAAYRPSAYPTEQYARPAYPPARPARPDRPSDPAGSPPLRGNADGPALYRSGGRRRRDPVSSPPARDETGDGPSGSWRSALLWTAGMFVVPVLLFLAWALTRSGVADAGCVDAAGAACPPPRTAALEQLTAALPALTGALGLGLLITGGLRRLVADWHGFTVGLAGAVIGAGVATLIAAILG